MRPTTTRRTTPSGSGLGPADLGADPARLARGIPAWARGDADEAALTTLELSRRELHGPRYTCWVWTGPTGDGTPAWILPVTAAAAAAFSPRGPARVLARCLGAAVESGAEPLAVSLLDWRGSCVLVLPGADLELAAEALAEAHPAPARTAAPALPPGVPVRGEPLDLVPIVRGGAGGLLTLARAAHVHPVSVALTLAAHGQPVDEECYPAGMEASLREWGCWATPPAPGAPSLAVEDDPCPRRRHARRVLQRLLRMGKVGPQYHTEFDHLYRGAPPDQRRDALAVGEALVRAGLLGEKPSVGQRHVYLSTPRLRDIHALIDRGETSDPALAAEWTRPAPGATGSLRRGP